MNRWSLVLWWVTVFGCLCSMSDAGSLGVRQRSVEACGPHPLIALAAASRPFAASASSLNDLIRAVRADPQVWSEMQILLRRYDDCIRAGDGLHYKRSKILFGALDKEQFPFSPSILQASSPEDPVFGSLPGF